MILDLQETDGVLNINHPTRKENNMECKKCKKDHTKKNEGPLTVCEIEEYRKQGSVSNHTLNNSKYHAFGTGNRFQFAGAK